MIFNYLRVSTVIQNTERQLLNIPCDRTYTDKLSGKDTLRPEFTLMMSNLRKGDLVNVHSLDRVGRNTKDILSIVQEIKDKDCLIRFHKENLTFDGTKSDIYSELMLTILSGFAEFERNIILERQREGISIAKQNGKYKGGKPKLSQEQILTIKKLKEDAVPIAQIARDMSCTRQTIYNALKRSAHD